MGNPPGTTPPPAAPQPPPVQQPPVQQPPVQPPPGFGGFGRPEPAPQPGYGPYGGNEPPRGYAQPGQPPPQPEQARGFGEFGGPAPPPQQPPPQRPFPRYPRETGSLNTGSITLGTLNTGPLSAGAMNTGAMNTGPMSPGGPDTGPMQRPVAFGRPEDQRSPDGYRDSGFRELGGFPAGGPGRGQDDRPGPVVYRSGTTGSFATGATASQSPDTGAFGATGVYGTTGTGAFSGPPGWSDPVRDEPVRRDPAARESSWDQPQQRRPEQWQPSGDWSGRPPGVPDQATTGGAPLGDRGRPDPAWRSPGSPLTPPSIPGAVQPVESLESPPAGVRPSFAAASKATARPVIAPPVDPSQVIASESTLPLDSWKVGRPSSGDQAQQRPDPKRGPTTSDPQTADDVFPLPDGRSRRPKNRGDAGDDDSRSGGAAGLGAGVAGQAAAAGLGAAAAAAVAPGLAQAAGAAALAGSAASAAGGAASALFPGTEGHGRSGRGGPRGGADRDDARRNRGRKGKGREPRARQADHFPEEPFLAEEPALATPAGRDRGQIFPPDPGLRGTGLREPVLPEPGFPEPGFPEPSRQSAPRKPESRRPEPALPTLGAAPPLERDRTGSFPALDPADTSALRGLNPGRPTDHHRNEEYLTGYRGGDPTDWEGTGTERITWTSTDELRAVPDEVVHHDELPEAELEPAPHPGRNVPAAIGIGLLLAGAAVAALLTRPEAYLALVSVAVVLAVYELASALTVREIAVPIVPLAVGSVGMLVSAFVAGEEGLLVAFVLTIIGMTLWRLMDGLDGAVRDSTAGVFAAAYVPFLAGFAVLLVAAPQGPTRAAIFMLLTVASDVGGYVVGATFGRHPMAPTVSPKKSWEGFCGSLLFCMVSGALAVTFLLQGPWWAGVAVGAAAAVSATIGDLGESLLKRDLGVKDMGRLLPGHGGIMDRMDSLLPTAPVVYVLLAILIPMV